MDTSTSVAAVVATQAIQRCAPPSRIAWILRSRALRSLFDRGTDIFRSAIVRPPARNRLRGFENLQDLLGEEMQIGRDPAQNEGEVMTLIVSQVFAILAEGKPTRHLKRRT